LSIFKPYLPILPNPVVELDDVWLLPNALCASSSLTTGKEKTAFQGGQQAKESPF